MRRWPTWRWHVRAWRLFFEPRDLWVGAYWSPGRWGEPGTLYLCPLPTLGLALTFGPLPCACGYDEGDGRHEDVRECMGTMLEGGVMGCPDPAAHHPYRAAPLWRRRSSALVMP